MAGTLTITSPATDSAGGNSNSSVLIAWSYAGTGGAVQTQWQVTATPVGSSTPTFDTGLQVGTQTNFLVSGFMTGVSYSVRVLICDTAGSVVSAYRTVISNYTRPLPPVITLWQTDYGIAVNVTNPGTDSSRPAVTSNAIYRRHAYWGEDWTYIGSTGANTTYTDYTAAAGYPYEYFARANGQIDSDLYRISGGPIMGAWVAEVADFINTSRHYVYAQAATESIDMESALHNFVGRTYPVPEVGVARNDTLAVSIRLTPDIRYDDEQWWRDWKRKTATLFYRDGRGRAWPVVIAGPLSIAPDGHGSIVTATLQRVDYNPTKLAAGAYGYISNVDGGNGVYGNGLQGNGN